ncbi:NCS2 family permease [Sulfurovum riftiae]|uniref:Guanine permease n=1 Tax=Sulfurovum riftiae TaxID=1630136 RepID=A0A151CI90_9BACT|nr:NCS2 family permease [Sulfurovum riftiae]KYJ87209.1 guanine permease [Sulfurovum riftiae]
MNYFKLKEHNTTVGTEIRAGMTTFIAMLYIVPVNASIMSAAGMPYDALITATAVMTILASILNGLWANTPIAMSVGMGLNAYFSFGLVKGMGIPWQSALGIVFLSGILYVLISMTPVRRWMIETIPMDIKRAVSAGIGAFIAFIGLEQSKMIVASSSTLVTIGDFKDAHVLLALLGLFLALFFTLKRYKSALMLSIVMTTLTAWVFGIEKLPESFLSMPASMAPIAFELDIASALTLSMLPVILIFLITDLFDTLGTLTGVGMRADLFRGKNSVPLQRTIEADAGATVFSGLAGVTSTTAFIESAAGVEEGGRTGLTAVVTGLLFILTLFFLPFFKAIPSNAIYPILIVIGVMMFSELQHINYKDRAVKFSAFFIVLGMPLTYSITNGLLLGALVFAFVRIIEGEYREIGMAMSILALVALLVFFVL